MQEEKRITASASDADVNDLSDKPLMVLFNRLIGNENKQNTVITDTQIMNIYEKEFNIKTDELHELEKDIYLSIMKKFLKDWPHWDEFSSAISQVNDSEKSKKVLLSNYRSLKNYLQQTIDIAHPKTTELIKEVEESFKKDTEEKETSEEDESDVLLEVHCSRQQLNTLFYRHPHPEQNYTIFNATESGPSKISLKLPDYQAILNWWNIKITFRVDSLQFVRSTVHDISHTLVNKKHSRKHKNIKLKKGYQEKAVMFVKNSDAKSIYKQILIDSLRNTYKYARTEHKKILEVLFSVFEKDLAELPSELKDMVMYRKYLSRYPYERYLYTDVPEAKDDEQAMKYDLQLREEVKPMYQWQMVKSEPIIGTKPSGFKIDLTGIVLECQSCSMRFVSMGQAVLELLRQHILSTHFQEPDWICSRCAKCFTMVDLASNRWSHTCYKENS